MQASLILLKQIVANRSWFAASLVAFFLPFTIDWSTVSLAAFFVILLSDSNVRIRLLEFTKHRLLYPLILLYIIYVISILYSSNKSEGWSNAGSMITLLLFPVFIAAMDFTNGERMKQVIVSLIAGCLL